MRLPSEAKIKGLTLADKDFTDFKNYFLSCHYKIFLLHKVQPCTVKCPTAILQNCWPGHQEVYNR